MVKLSNTRRTFAESSQVWSDDSALHPSTGAQDRLMPGFHCFPFPGPPNFFPPEPSEQNHEPIVVRGSFWLPKPPNKHYPQNKCGLVSVKPPNGTRKGGVQMMLQVLVLFDDWSKPAYLRLGSRNDFGKTSSPLFRVHRRFLAM